jgi:hypothetical protein
MGGATTNLVLTLLPQALSDNDKPELSLALREVQVFAGWTLRNSEASMFADSSAVDLSGWLAPDSLGADASSKLLPRAEDGNGI